MHSTRLQYRGRLLLGLLVVGATLKAASPDTSSKINLEISRRGSSLELQWAPIQPAGAVVEYEIQRSRDLGTWERIGSRPVDATGTQLIFPVPATGQNAFYRVLGNSTRQIGLHAGTGGAEVFGYAARFADEIKRIGQITPEQFASRYPSGAQYLPAISWDPTTAKFWEAFQTDPEAFNRGLIPSVDKLRNFDFRLSPQELTVFKRNGFVVSERLRTYSFAEGYYRVWNDDLPVFITTDSLLQAWHRSYDAMLEELEETHLTFLLGQLLDGMAAQVPALWKDHGQGALNESILDADFFLAVARSLLTGKQIPTLLSQDARVKATLTAVGNEQLQDFQLFGTNRVVDFSQFKIRGHYENSERLGHYFQATMWVGRIDMRVAGNPEEAHPRELGSAIVLNELLKQSGQFETWREMDQIIQTFVGWTDSMTFAQLGEVLAAASINSLADVPDLETLTRLQGQIEQGTYGAQNIRSDYYESPFGPEQIRLPRSFTVFGQKFVPDSWAFSQMVYDSIIWDEDGKPGEEDKVQRRVPSGLDVVFTVLGNNQIVPELVTRIKDQTGRKFRDGLPYQHNMAAVREVVESQGPSVWESNVYMNWLSALRELSAPTTDSIYPEAMRTRAWAMKTVNTQLASWTQLRHDTILYAKQSYTGGGACFYPDGFVEPLPRFWAGLRKMADRATELLGRLGTTGQVEVEMRDGSGTASIKLADIQKRRAEFFGRFADTARTLEEISKRELAQEPLSAEQTQFIERFVQITGQLGWGANREYNGTYPRLFYKSTVYGDGNELFFQTNFGADKTDVIVADVHTDVPDVQVGDPGSVLHEAIGEVHMMLIAVDNGSDRMVYAGPVMSHFEFELIGPPKRLSDSDWKDIYYNQLQIHPDWTRSFLVPTP